MSANKLNTTTFNTVAANTVTDAVIDAPSILGWRQNVQVVVDQHADQINAIQGALQNALINANFAVNQLVKSGTVTLAAGAYGHDMWKAGASGCTYTFATSNNVTTITITAGSLIQVIEGINLFSGTYTLSWTGTAPGKIGAGSYGVSGITGSVTGGTNLNIEFNTGTLSKVQFNAGDTALPFQPRSFAEELVMCQWYYEKSYDYAIAPGTGINDKGIVTKNIGTNTISNGTIYGETSFKTEKRIQPTVTIYPYNTPSNTGRVSDNSGTDLAANTGIVGRVGTSGFCVSSNAAATTTGNAVIFHWAADARL